MLGMAAARALPDRVRMGPFDWDVAVTEAATEAGFVEATVRATSPGQPGAVFVVYVTPSRAMRRDRGFSLLELVVVLAIFALVALIGVKVIQSTLMADRRLQRDRRGKRRSGCRVWPCCGPDLKSAIPVVVLSARRSGGTGAGCTCHAATGSA